MAEFSVEEANRRADEAVQALVFYLSPYFYKQDTDNVQELALCVAKLRAFIHKVEGIKDKGVING